MGAVSEAVEAFDEHGEEKISGVENPLLKATFVKSCTYSSRMFNGIAYFYWGLNQVSGLQDGDQVDLVLENGIIVKDVFVVKASETEPVLYSNVPQITIDAALQMIEGKTHQRPTNHYM